MQKPNNEFVETVLMAIPADMLMGMIFYCF